MARGKVTTLSEFKAQRLMRREPAAKSGAFKGLPDADHLQELLDRNISLKIWQKGI